MSDNSQCQDSPTYTPLVLQSEKMTKREVWNHFRGVLLEDEGKSKYASVFALLGVNEWDDMAMLDESDLIDSFPVTTARAITITMKFWAKGDDDREAVILKLANRSQWMAFCQEQRQLENQASSDHNAKGKIVENFEKGIKRDPTAFKVLKDPKLFRKWLDATQATAKAQGVFEAFNPDYTPVTDVDKMLFMLKQEYGYSVIQNCVQTLAGTTIVKKFASSSDCQSAIRELIKTHEQGITGKMNVKELEDKIRELRLNDKYTKPLHSFLVYFSSQLLDLQQLKGVEIPDSDKISWLRNAVLSHTKMYEALDQYDTIQDTLESNGMNVPKDFQSLFEHLSERAKKHDRDQEKRSTPTRKIQAAQSKKTNNDTPILSNSDYVKEKEKLKNDMLKPKTEWMKMSSEARDKHRQLYKDKLNALQSKYRVNKSQRVTKSQSSTDSTTQQSDTTSIGDQVTVPINTLQQIMTIVGKVAGSGGTSNAGLNAEQNINDVITLMSSLNATKPSSGTPATTAASSTDAGAFIRHILQSNGHGTTTNNTNSSSTIKIIDGKVYYSVNNLKYELVHYEGTSHEEGALIDGGANGGLRGDDCIVIETHPHRRIDVSGICDSEEQGLSSDHIAAVVETQKGPIIGHWHHYAGYGKGKTVHSKGQMSHFGIVIDDTSRNVGGNQRLVTPDGYVIPLSVRKGLAYMDMRKPTVDEMLVLPHVNFTADHDTWDPSVLDNEYNVNDMDDIQKTIDDHAYVDPALNDYGEILEIRERDIDMCIQIAKNVHQQHNYNKYDIKDSAVDYELLRQNFGFVPAQRVKDTLFHTTQFYRASTHLPFRVHFKSRFPANNVRRLNEDIAMDTMFSDTPALDDGVMGHGGVTMCQLYTGIKSDLTAAYPMSSESQIGSTVQDFIREWGAPIRLRSDQAKAATGKVVTEILRYFCVGWWFSEAYMQHQNKAERKMQTVKRITKNIMDRFGIPAIIWLLIVLYVVDLLNHLASSDGSPPPLTKVTGQPTDISAFMTFHPWELVYYATNDSYPSSSGERLGRWLGPEHHVGDILTYRILDCETWKLLYRSNVRTAENSPARNQRVEKEFAAGEGEESSSQKLPSLTSPGEVRDFIDNIDSPTYKTPIFSPEDLIGLTFLKEQEDGTVIRAKVERQIRDRDAENHQNIKFLLNLGDGQLEELIAYNELSDLIERRNREEAENPDELFYAFKSIESHEGPLDKNNENYKGSTFNLLVHWEDGSKTWEPLYYMSKEDPVTVAEYANRHGLLDTPGWKHLNKYVRRTKKFRRMLNQAKAQAKHNAPQYMFGVRVPRTVKEAYQLDAENGNTLWTDSIATEMNQLHEYSTFKDGGHPGTGARAPDGYQKIRCHMIFAVKHDLRRKSRFVAGGHMTDTPKDSTYSSVVSLRGLRLAIFLAELNGLQIYQADVGNAYLEAYTSEKVYFIAGPEFKELEGHIMIIVKALYGLRSSGARFRDKFLLSLRQIGFFQCRNEPDIWLRNCNDHYEYICVWVDDLAICSHNAQAIIDVLADNNGPHKYKFKGVGDITYHLGGNFFRDPDGTLVYSAETYIKKIIEQFDRTFSGEDLKTCNCPLRPDDHPELDLTIELGSQGQQQYQSLIGQFQWAISLCRFDISVATMTLSRFRTSPREGHLERAKRILGYLKAHPDGAIRFRTGIPDYDGLEMPQHDWMSSVYGLPEEQINPSDPPPLGKPVRTTTFKDANLMHDLITGRSASGILHLINQTPIEWFSKRQATVETATYGSEFVCARQACEQIIDLRLTLRSLGVPLDGPSWLFGDNKSVITSSTIPHSNLSKRHNALAYHKTRETCAAKIVNFIHISGVQNVADCMTKFLSYPVWRPLIEPLLFWKGNTLKSLDTSLVTEQSMKLGDTVIKTRRAHFMSVMEEMNTHLRTA